MEGSHDFSTTSKHSAGGLQMTSTEFTAYTSISFIVVLWCLHKWNRRHFKRVALKMSGLSSYPFIGSGFEFIGTPQRKKNNNNSKTMRKKILLLFSFSEVMDSVFKMFNGFEPRKLWLGSYFLVTISKPEDLQVII